MFSENEKVALRAITQTDAESLSYSLSLPLRPIIRSMAEICLEVQGTGAVDWERHEEPVSLAMTHDLLLWNMTHPATLEEVLDSIEAVADEQVHPLVAELFIHAAEDAMRCLWDSGHPLISTIEEALAAFTQNNP